MNKKIIIVIAGLIGFIWMLYLVISGSGQGFDDAVRFWFYNQRNSSLNQIARLCHFLGSWRFIVPLCILLLAVPKTRIKVGIPAATGALSVSLINTFLKHIILRERPDEIYHIISQGGYSFPSGHSITSVMFYGILTYLIYKNVSNKKISYPLMAITFVLAVIIGPSRIYAGVHYPTDVLAGIFLGISALAAEIIIITKIERRGLNNGI